jgi:hypothetical protein
MKKTRMERLLYLRTKNELLESVINYGSQTFDGLLKYISDERPRKVRVIKNEN